MSRTKVCCVILDESFSLVRMVFGDVWSKSKVSVDGCETFANAGLKPEYFHQTHSGKQVLLVDQLVMSRRPWIWLSGIQWPADK